MKQLETCTSEHIYIDDRSLSKIVGAFETRQLPKGDFLLNVGATPDTPS